MEKKDRNTKKQENEKKPEFPQDIRKTRQREIIFSILFKRSEPVSAAELYGCLVRETGDARLAVSTVYRALSAFEEKGYVLKTRPMGEETAYYEWNRGTHRHYAVCLGCHKRFPLESCPFEHAKLDGFTVTGHKLELYGYCGRCHPVTEDIR